MYSKNKAFGFVPVMSLHGRTFYCSNKTSYVLCHAATKCQDRSPSYQQKCMKARKAYTVPKPAEETYDYTSRVFIMNDSDTIMIIEVRLRLCGFLIAINDTHATI
jgi:hypothetical protein